MSFGFSPLGGQVVVGQKIGLEIYYNGTDDLRVRKGSIHVSDGSGYTFKFNSDTQLTGLSALTGWNYVTVNTTGAIQLRQATGTIEDRPLDKCFQVYGYDHNNQGYYYSVGERIIGAIYRIDANTWYCINCGEGTAETGENQNGEWVRDKDGWQTCNYELAPMTTSVKTSGGFYYASNRWKYPVKFAKKPVATPIVVDAVSGLFTASIGYDLSAYSTKNTVDHVDIEIFGTVAEEAVSSVATARGAYKDCYTSVGEFFDGIPYKGQLHCHTTNSDGLNSPKDLANEYRKSGYDFLSITDHDVLTTDPNVVYLTFIPGIEETSRAGELVSHVAVYDVTTQTETTATVEEIMTFHTNNGSLVSAAHPELSNIPIPTSTLISATGYGFIEVWNALVEGQESGETSWDAVLSAGKKVWGIAVDDCHNFVANGNRAWVVVYAKSNTKEDFLSALQAGNFYATTGNDIATHKDGNTITAISSYASNFEFISDNGVVVKTVNNTRKAEYNLTGSETYVRVKATRVSDSEMAWSQPIFLN